MQHFILIASFFFITVYLVVLIKNNFNQTQYFSEIVASQAWSRKFYCIWNILFIISCSIFFYGYLIPEFNLSYISIIFISIFLLSTLAIGIFPRHGKTKKAHKIAASCAGICIIPLVAAITIETWIMVPWYFHFAEIVYLFFALAVTISQILNLKYIKKHLFIYQTILIWGVMVLIVALTYIT